MLKSYNKSLAYTYSVGVYPSLELLQNRPKDVAKVVVDARGKENTGLQKILELCDKLGVTTEVSPATVQKIAKSENAYCLGVVNKYLCDLEQGENHLVLVNPSDMGNLGTIIRTALAFDVVNLAIIKPACDIFDPKVIRASMGALFKIRFAYFDTFADYVDSQNRSENNLYTFRTNGDVELADCGFKQPFSLIFGNEGSGLPEEFESIGDGVKIPQSNSVDSLNLSVAVGIVLQHAHMQKG